MADNEKSEEVLPETADPSVPIEEDAVQRLQQERNDLFERLLRKQAEFENYKKRVEREKSEYVQYASSELVKELLNTLDSFDLAIRNASSDSQDDSAGSETMLRGFELIHKQFQDTLGRFGLKPVDAKGAKFDPNIHQAVATKATNDVEENTVVEELRRGYVLNGRLLRAAMVSVSVKK